MRSFMLAFAKAMNLVNPEIQHHHEQTAYLTLFIAREMGLPKEDEMLALYAALLHDIGSVTIEKQQSLLEVERQAREIARIGARMLGDMPGFSDIADVIALCQSEWAPSIEGAIERGEASERIGVCASVVHLADAVSTLLKYDEHVLNQVNGIIDVVKRYSGAHFCPQAVEAFLAISGTEHIWMDLVYNPMFLAYFTGDIAPVSLEEALFLTRLASRIIDYRSPFTAMHSAGVAASARTLAKLAGFGDDDVTQMTIAGNLHDIGKLAVPKAILEKPGKLTAEEFNVVKEHPYFTTFVLLDVKGFEHVRHWAANHHEKLTGRGYPFHLGYDELDAGDRIMAVADIFSAIAEERPYRAGMTREQAAKVLADNAESGGICSDVVALLMENYEEVNAERDRVSRLAGRRYFESIGQ